MLQWQSDRTLEIHGIDSFVQFCRRSTSFRSTVLSSFPSNDPAGRLHYWVLRIWLSHGLSVIQIPNELFSLSFDNLYLANREDSVSFRINMIRSLGFDRFLSLFHLIIIIIFHHHSFYSTHHTSDKGEQWGFSLWFEANHSSNENFHLISRFPFSHFVALPFGKTNWYFCSFFSGIYFSHIFLRCIYCKLQF